VKPIEKCGRRITGFEHVKRYDVHALEQLALGRRLEFEMPIL
jgi:hypothetical protein